MLAGYKPLAAFCEAKGRFPDVLVRYLRLFDRHVAAGRFLRVDDFSKTGAQPFIIHRVLFAPPGEQWRIQAMIDLWDAGHWSPELERREGELLGYEDWMNDYWLEFVFGK